MLKKFTFKADIRRKFMIFAIIPSFLLAISLLFFIVTIKEETIKEDHIKILKTIDYKLSSFYSDLSLLETMIIDSNNKDKNLFNDILRFNNHISSIIVFSKDGKMKKTYFNEKNNIDKNFNYFKTFDFPKLLDANKSTIGNAYTTSKTNEAFIPYLFENKGTIYLFNISLDYFKEFAKEIGEDDSSVKICIVDKNGACILNSLVPDSFDIKISFYNTPYSKAVLLNNEYQLIKLNDKYKNQTLRLTYANQKQSGWKIIVKDEYDKIYDGIRNILIIIALFILFLLIVTIITANKVAKNIVEPIESLILEIEDFANETEHFEETSTIKSKYYIFNVLIESFEKMKNDIIDREIELKNLNENLEEKTAQLELFNQTLQIRLQNED